MSEWALRIDNNGVIAGVVLRSDIDNMGVVASAMIVQADMFAVVAPGGAASPVFVHYSTPRVVNGQTLPAGTYLENVNIDYAQIGVAQIDELQLAGRFVTNPKYVFVIAETAPISAWSVLATLTIVRKSGLMTSLDISLQVFGESATTGLRLVLQRKIGSGAWGNIHQRTISLNNGPQNPSFKIPDENTSGGSTQYRLASYQTGSLDTGDTAPTAANVSLSAEQFQQE